MFEIPTQGLSDVLGVSNDTINAGLPIIFIVIGVGVAFYVLTKILDLFNPFS